MEKSSIETWDQGPHPHEGIHPHGVFRGISADARRCLFADLVCIVNEHKCASVAATLASEAYHRVFKGLTKRSMYGACFAQLAMMNDVESRLNDHHQLIPYVLDDGNSYKNDIIEAGRILRLPSLKTVEFCTDTSLCALQAADVVTWSVRRRLAGQFPSGLEPLQGLFDKHHLDLDYREEWMVGVADSHRLRQAAAREVTT